MVTFEEKSLVTRIVGRIKEILEEVSANPKDYDLLKSSVEIYELVLRSLREDLEIAESIFKGRKIRRRYEVM